MHVAVIGGGIAGLAAAHRLVGAGHEVTVFEGEPRAGGVLHSERDGGWLCEHAANAFLSGSPDGAVALCRELGVALEEPSPASKLRWIWRGGKLHPLPLGPGALIKSELLSWRGKLRLLREPFVRARPPSKNGDESVWDFAARRLGPEVADALIGPFVTGVFAGDAREVSLAAGFPSLAGLEEKGGLVRGMFAGRRRGTPRPEPRRSLAPHDGTEALPRALRDKLGARVRTAARVANVTCAPGEVRVDGARFDGAVLATPAHVTASIVAVPEIAAAARGIHYAPAVIAHLGFRRDDVALDGFGILVAAGETPRLLGIVFESLVWPGRAPDGHVLVRCILGGTRDPRAIELDDAAVIAAARADLAQIVGVHAAPVRTQVARWPRGIAQYAVGHGERVAAADAVARGQRLVLAGSGWHGVAVTDCVADARRVVDEVARW